LRETGTSSLLIHDDGAELLMIADEDDLLATENQRDHAF
jgi:hypothetical protein